ncbi:c-type cytochrome [bacterium]|nr:c-type cytochrome [bacterium]
MRQLILLTLCLSLTSPAFAADAPPEPLKVLLITGGCCHDYTAQKEILKKGLEARAHVDVVAIEQGGQATNSKIELYEDENWADGFDVIIHDECFSDAKDIPWVDRVLKPHRDGLPAVVIHCAMHCYRDGRDDWFKFCGVTSRGHGAHYAHEVLNRDAAHPIMQTFPAGWANPAGELYRIEKLWPTAHPLASTKDRELANEQVCVWTNEFGDKKTRVFGTTLGHHNETVSHPVFLDMVTRGTLWAAGKLDKRYLKTPEEKIEYVPVNLALNKPAKASSEETGKNNFAPHAFDGNRSTRWCAANGSAPQWAQVDLGEKKHLTGCRLDWESTSTIYRYQVEGSDDGESWQVLVERSKNTTDREANHEFDAHTRFVRVKFLGSDTGGWGSLWEVAIHGDEKVKVDPTEIRNAAEAERLAEVKLPEGFEATIFAVPPAVNYPVFVAAAPNGDVYVSVDKNGSLDRELKRGSIHRLRDLDGDGRADEAKFFVADVDSPRGLVWDHDRLYVMHPPHLSAFIDHDGDGISDEQKILVKNLAFTFKDRPADHTTNGVTLGIDGWLYIACGDFGFMEAEGTDGRKLQLRGGGVVRVRPDGTELETYSIGTRNILEVAMDPLLNGFTRDNTNDGGGWDIRLHHFTGLENHGYPRLFRNFGDEIIQPLADYGGGSGCGTLYLDEPGFPDGYSDALYTADWGRQMVYRHNFWAKGATFSADQHEFLGLPRVTDLDVDASSRIIAASWKGATFKYEGESVGYLVQVTPKGYQPEPLPNFEMASDADLIVLLESPSHRRRLEAQRTLLRRGLNADVRRGLEALAGNSQKPLASRVAAVFALKQGLGAGSHATLAKLADQDATIRPFAIRALGDRATTQSGVPIDVIKRGLSDSHPRTRLEAAVALARLNAVDATSDIVPLLGDADPVIAHTAVQTLVRLNPRDACFAVVDGSETPASVHAGALRVLQSLHEISVVNGLLKRLDGENDPSRRRGLLAALCRLYNVEGEWTGNSWGTRPDTRGPYYQPEEWAESARIGAALEAELKTASVDDAAFLIRTATLNRIERASFEKILQQRAKDDERFIPVVVIGQADGTAPSADTVPLFMKVATGDGYVADLRSQAVRSLLRVSGRDAFAAALTGLALLQQDGSAGGQFAAAQNALQDRDTLLAHAQDIATLIDSDGPARTWANIALLLLSEQKKLKGQAAKVVEKSLDADWKRSPQRRIELLNAAWLADHRSFEPRVREALVDDDPKVVAAAQRLANAWKLSTGPVPGGPKIETLKPEDAIAQVVKHEISPGDVDYGRQVFARLKCSNCHTVNPGEPLRGPYLPNVAKTYRRDQLAEAILLPSKSIAQGFKTNIFILDSGKSLTGFVTNEAATEITIRNAEGQELKLPVESIEDRVEQQISVMPEGLAKNLTLGELAALIEYLESLESLATEKK